MKLKKEYFKYILALLIFGSNGVISEFIALSSAEIVFLRAVFGSAFLLLLFFLTGNRFTAFQNKRDFLFVVLSGVSMAADWLLLFEAYAQIGVSLGMLINYFGPVLVILLSPLVLKEKMSGKKLVSAAVAFLGVVLVGGKAAVGGLGAKGLFCAVLSAFAYCGMVLLNKLSKNIVGIENAALQLLSATIVIVIYNAFGRGLIVQTDKRSFALAVLLGVVNTGLGCFLYFSASSRLPAQSVAVCGYLEPLSAVILSAVVLSEKLSPLQIFGAALIISGALFGECHKKTAVKTSYF